MRKRRSRCAEFLDDRSQYRSTANDPKTLRKKKNMHEKNSIIFLQNKQRDINGSDKSGKRIATHQLKCQLVSSSTCT